MLKCAPAIPDSRANCSDAPLTTSLSHGTLYLEAELTWVVPETGGCGCGIDGKQKTREVSLSIGIPQPISLSFRNDTFSAWPGTEHEQKDGVNLIGILALSWSYIFSAQLVERQGQGGTGVIHTSAMAEICDSKTMLMTQLILILAMSASRLHDGGWRSWLPVKAGKRSSLETMKATAYAYPHGLRCLTRNRALESG